MKDPYIEKYVQGIKEATNDEQIALVLNKVYEDGFIDGNNEKE